MADSAAEKQGTSVSAPIGSARPAKIAASDIADGASATAVLQRRRLCRRSRGRLRTSRGVARFTAPELLARHQPCRPVQARQINQHDLAKPAFQARAYRDPTTSDIAESCKAVPRPPPCPTVIQPSDPERAFDALDSTSTQSSGSPVTRARRGWRYLRNSQ